MEPDNHKIDLRVRYKETDQMGVVYYSNYLVWFEIARTEYFRDIGIVYKDLEEKDKIFLPVTESYCRYKAPIRYDDMIDIITKVTDVGAMRITFEYEVRRENKIMATGKTKHAFINPEGIPVPIPEKIRDMLGK